MKIREINEELRISPVSRLEDTAIQETAPEGERNPFALTEEQQQALNYSAARQMIQMQSREFSRDCAYLRKKDEDECRAELKKDILEHKELIHMRRRLINFEVAELDDGFVYKFLRDPDGKIIGGKPLCSAKNLRITIYYAEGCQETVALVAWGEIVEPPEFFLVLKEENLTPQNLGKELAKHGVTIYGDRALREELLMQLLAFLIRGATYVEVPQTTGWLKLHGAWRFVKKHERNLREMLKNV